MTELTNFQEMEQQQELHHLPKISKMSVFIFIKPFQK